MTVQTLIMASRAGRPEHTPEAEPVLVETEGVEVRLVLDGGEEIVFDRVELLAALGIYLAGTLPGKKAA